MILVFLTYKYIVSFIRQLDYLLNLYNFYYTQWGLYTTHFNRNRPNPRLPM